MDELITLEQISKTYHGVTILNRIDLSIRQGQSIALTGHNGSGKSTLLKTAAGLVRPDSGRVRYGRNLLFGYVPEHFPKMNLTAAQYLKSMGKISGLSGYEIEKRCRVLLADFFLTELADVPMKHLSKGSLQKVGAIQAFLKQPDILLLDEPLSGQDTDSQRVFIKKVNELRERGVTVLMSCHEQALIDALSGQSYRIESGKLTPAPARRKETGEAVKGEDRDEDRKEK